MVAENGGGAFALIYILAILVLALPLMLSELAIGANTKASAALSLQKLSSNRLWWWAGLLPLLTSFCICVYYTVLTGWTLGFGVLCCYKPSCSFTAITSQSYLFAVTLPVITWLTTGFIVAKGVRSGIETLSSFLMPILLVPRKSQCT